MQEIIDLEKIATFEIDITYQDTDIAGVVYFSNYLDYAERGRSKLIRSLFGKSKFSKEQNWAVKDISANYFKPVKLDSKMIVKTSIDKLGAASILFKHDCFVEDILVCSTKATLLSINEDLKPVRIDKEIYQKLLKIYKMEK